MKLIFYALAVVSIVAAGFFSFQVKENYAEKITNRDDLITRNKNLGKTIEEKQEEKKGAEADKVAAVDSREEVKAQFESSKAKGKQLDGDLEGVQDDLDAAKAKQADVTKIIDGIKVKFPDIDIADVPKIYADLEAKQLALKKELEEQEFLKTNLVAEVTKNNGEIERVGTKIDESKVRVRGNDFQATITSVNNEWDFLVIAAGEKSGLAGDSRLLVQRGGRLIGKVAISSLEANQAVAEVVPGTLAPGAIIQPGDQVILEKVKSN